MTTVLITGARGFLGRNLAARLRARGDARVLTFDRGDPEPALDRGLATADAVFHLAGVNRPADPADFETGNAGFTAEVCDRLHALDRAPYLVVSSSAQAALDNPYGVSKRRAEAILARFAAETNARVSAFRLRNVFGKWARPDYNSVVATFCHNLARDLPIRVDDPGRVLELVHVDDVMDAFLAALDAPPPRDGILVEPDPIPWTAIALGDLADRLGAFRQLHRTRLLPDLSSRFDRQLYGTYLSYVPPGRWAYGLEVREDARGELAEVVRSPAAGQVFVSRTRPGVTRGEHYHDTKAEKFLVLAGEALIRLRPVDGDEVVAFRIAGEDHRVLDIPPGYTHSITNVGDADLITLFWASEVFDPARPDTVPAPVGPAPEPVLTEAHA